MFEVLRLLAHEKKPLDAAHVAKTLGIPMTSTLRVLGTLEAAGFAERDRAGGRYRIGKAASTLSLAFMSQFAVRDLALPYLQRMTLETGQTSSLFVRLGWNALRVAAVLGHRTLMHSTPVGETRPLWGGAHGRAILANLTDADRAEISGQLDSELGADEQAELAGLARSRLVRGECYFEAGVDDCGWPIFNGDGLVIASVGFEAVPGPILDRILAADSLVHKIIAEISATAARELAGAISHYDHIPAAEIAFVDE